MSEAPRTPQEQKEAAAIRRRWITLGEVLAVAAVVISALTFWNGYSERTANEAERAVADAEKAAERKDAAARTQRSRLGWAAPDEGRPRALAPLDVGQAVQNVAIAFPTALRADPVDAVIAPRIEARWLTQAARAARDAEGDSVPSGDRRLPVAITTRFVSGGETYSDTTLYDIGYRLEGGGLLGGADARLTGLSLIARVPAAEAQTRLDALWSERHPPRAEKD